MLGELFMQRRIHAIVPERYHRAVVPFVVLRPIHVLKNRHCVRNRLRNRSAEGVFVPEKLGQHRTGFIVSTLVDKPFNHPILQITELTNLIDEVYREEPSRRMRAVAGDDPSERPTQPLGGDSGVRAAGADRFVCRSCLFHGTGELDTRLRGTGGLPRHIDSVRCANSSVITSHRRGAARNIYGRFPIVFG